MSGARTSWQTLLADLALVLFIITAAALGREKLSHKPVSAPTPATAVAPMEASPLAIWRDLPGAPSLAEWLKQQSHDPRQQITIVARYRAGTEQAIPERVATLLAAAGTAGVHARIVVEPGDGSTSAGVAFDAGPMARDLHLKDQAPQQRNPQS